MRSRRYLPVVLLVLAVAPASYVSTSRRATGPPLDPSSTSPDGTRALVVLLEQFDAEVEVVDGAPRIRQRGGVALLLEDRLTEGQVARLDEFIDDGGRLIVADPRSAYAPAPAGSLADATQGSCTIEALAEVTQLVAPLVRLRTGGADAACFTDERGAVVVAERRGAGVVVAVGGTAIFTNEHLDEADNAALVVALLAPTAGTEVAILRPALAGTGERELADLIEDPVRAFLFQLLVAFGFVVLWRGRRLGKPVSEAVPVEIEASELTRAVGRLLESNRHPERAADVLREHAWSVLRTPLGIPDNASRRDVVAALAEASTLTPEEIDGAVFAPVSTDAELVAVARTLTRLRQEVLHDRRPARS